MQTTHDYWAAALSYIAAGLALFVEHPNTIVQVLGFVLLVARLTQEIEDGSRAAKGPATEGTLGDLHNKVADVMIGALATIEKAQEAYSAMDTEVIAEKGIKEPELNPALLSVMVRFLDANKITCAPEAGNTMSDLEQRLADKSKKRRAVGNVVHLTDD